MPDYPQEGTLRGGHITGAKSVPWGRAANSDGTFKSADELRAIYETEQGLNPTDDVIAYCRIGERSSHTGLFSPTFSATKKFATTMAAGPNGEMRFARRLKRAGRSERAV